MRGVLIDNDKAVFGFGDDVGRGNLATGDAHGVAEGFGRCVVSRFRAGHRRCDKGRAAVKDGRLRPLSPLAARVALSHVGRGSGGGPRPQCCRTWPWLAAVPCSVERLAEAADNQTAHQSGVAEADFGFGRVDVDIDHIGRDVEEKGDNGMAVSGEHVGIGTAHGANQQAVLYRTTVDEQELVIGDTAVEGRQPCDAAEADRFAMKINRDAVVGQGAVGERGDASGLAFGLHRQGASSVMFDRE